MGLQKVHEHEAFGGGFGRRLYCRLTSFSRSLQINLRINLDGTLANQAVATINLKGRKIFLFGTAGFGGSAAYFQKILDHIKQSVDPSNTVVGEYMCQGKMPQSVRDRYMKMKAQPEHSANIDALIKNFDRAISHPDEDDLERLRKIILG